MLCLAALLFVACGGGGADVGKASPTLRTITPAAILSRLPKFLVLEGSGFGSAGDSAVLRLTAETGPPFHEGTSETVDIPATVGSDTANPITSHQTPVESRIVAATEK